MLKTFSVDKSNKYLLIQGKTHFIIAEPDCCHSVYTKDDPIEICYNTLSEPDANGKREFELRTFSSTLEGVRAIAKPTTLQTSVHYWGIKSRVKTNFDYLCKTMQDIGIDTYDLPKWGETADQYTDRRALEIALANQPSPTIPA